MYVHYQIATISPYSVPILKVRNFRLAGQLYSSTYTINVSSSDNIGMSNIIKYEKGVYDKEYFKTNGISGSGSIVVDSNGTYTVYVEDLAGNGTVATIDIDKIV